MFFMMTYSADFDKMPHPRSTLNAKTAMFGTRSICDTFMLKLVFSRGIIAHTNFGRAPCICNLFAISDDIFCALCAISFGHYFHTPIRSNKWLLNDDPYR